MKIYYWAPYFSKIATINAVLNSFNSIKIKNLNSKVLNTVGEWDVLDPKDRVDITRNRFVYNNIKKIGFIRSRFFSIYVFFSSIKGLLRIFNEKKKTYLIIHLITSLPIFINFFKKNKNIKVILRISGYPQLNFPRKFLWKYLAKKCFLVTAPTKETMNRMIKDKIFTRKKISILRDPIISSVSNIKIKRNLKTRKKFLCVGRLTDQKNFSFIIHAFSKLNREKYDFSVSIVGDGEQRKLLSNLISMYKLNNKIKLCGYQKNIAQYYKTHDCLIVSSKWEDPGFVLIEAANCGMPIISSNCPSGPTELLENGNLGYLYKTDDFLSFKKSFLKYLKDSESTLLKKTKKLKKKLIDYTFEKHSKNLKKLLN